jgi:hypothetical protein
MPRLNAARGIPGKSILVCIDNYISDCIIAYIAKCIAECSYVCQATRCCGSPGHIKGGVIEMKTAKKPMTFRLTETTRNELAGLAKRQRVSQADVIAILVHAVCVGWEFEDLDEYFEAARLC